MLGFRGGVPPLLWLADELLPAESPNRLDHDGAITPAEHLHASSCNHTVECDAEVVVVNNSMQQSDARAWTLVAHARYRRMIGPRMDVRCSRCNVATKSDDCYGGSQREDGSRQAAALALPKQAGRRIRADERGGMLIASDDRTMVFTACQASLLGIVSFIGQNARVMPLPGVTFAQAILLVYIP